MEEGNADKADDNNGDDYDEMEDLVDKVLCDDDDEDDDDYDAVVEDDINSEDVGSGRGSGGKNVIFSNAPNSTFECFNIL